MKSLYVLLALVPVTVLLAVLHAEHTWIFLSAALALVPLSALIGKATDELALRLGPALGGLLNVTLGNAAELIITIVALRGGQPELVKASISGSVLGNILLVMGMSLLVGGLRHGRQRFSARLVGPAATMMTLAVVALMIPALFRFGPHEIHPHEMEFFSVGVASVLLVIYGLYLFYTLGPHDVESELRKHAHQRPKWTQGRALAVLGAATVGAVVMSELLVGAIEPVVHAWGVTQLFLGVIVVPIVGNAAEHWAAIQAAADDKMDLSLGIALGSSLQIALFVAPVLVFVSQALGHPIQLVFNQYELAALAGAVIVAAFVAVDGESNWVEGAQLLALYLIIGLGFFYLS